MGKRIESETALFKLTHSQEPYLAGGSLMPTPKAQDGVKGNLKTSAEREEAGFFVDLPNVAVDLAQDNQLLPTPRAQEPGSTSPGYGDSLNDVTNRMVNGVAPKDLLPTTRTSMKNGATQKEIELGNPKTRLETEVMLGDISWGKFEPAIRRWEQVLGRPAPAPTKPDGKDGAHRLSSKFTEWMMGLPDGWITGHGLSRNDELKMAGNGVVPQQAALALRVLLEGIDIPNGGGQVNLPTPTVSDTYTDNLASTQQKPGSMHSVTLPQAVKNLNA